MAANWGLFTNTGGDDPHRWRFPFAGAPHILGTSYLGEFSQGAQNGVGGAGVVTFKRYEFLDSGGLVQEVELSTEPVTFLEVTSCVSITVEINLNDATVLGGWSFYWLTP
jgi:hypothetical protein